MDCLNLEEEEEILGIVIQRFSFVLVGYRFSLNVFDLKDRLYPFEKIVTTALWANKNQVD